MKELLNKTWLITGGTGSFGSALTKTLLEKYNPLAVRIFSRDEFKQSEMEKEFNSDTIRFLLGDVRDESRLYRAMQDVDIVVHAAALKQVPKGEYNPSEFLLTNVSGAMNVVNAALDAKVEKIMAISSDKAVNAINLYGVSKAASERLFVAANSYSGKQKTRFSCCRYGNVVGSRGSVIPLFQEQAVRAGAITITHPEMTRFLIGLQEGVNFVINSIAMMEGGEVFIPKMPSATIMDIAEAVAPEAERMVVGIKPGEKLHETLITEDEARHTREFQGYFVIIPEHPFWTPQETKGNLPEGYRYGSDNNEHWLSVEEIRRMIE